MRRRAATTGSSSSTGRGRGYWRARQEPATRCPPITSISSAAQSGQPGSARAPRPARRGTEPRPEAVRPRQARSDRHESARVSSEAHAAQGDPVGEAWVIVKACGVTLPVARSRTDADRAPPPIWNSCCGKPAGVRSTAAVSPETCVQR